MNPKLVHGASWYPECWSRAVLEQDIRLMREVGINVVRIGEFCWAAVEPAEDEIDISLFAAIIEQLYASGIETVMCTPTPTPPVWLTHGHPERCYVDHSGTVMGHGARQHICMNHPYFRQRAAILTERLAQKLAPLPGLIAWQLDNEFKAHVSECMCGTCRTLWHSWLERRYGSIGRLNEAWGTAVWSQTYQRFDQVPQPGPAPFLHNSSLETMYRLFSMEALAEFADEQAAIIRRYSAAPITHNSSVAFHVDNERLFKHLDFASYDTYASQENQHAYLLNCDLWRNFKPGQDFWVMETSPSYAASLQSYAVPHPNGYLKAEAVAAYALGAGAFCYWLWRQQRAGSEQTHGSILSAWGEPAVGYANVLETEQARRAIEPVMLATRPVRAEVAITYSDRAKAFLATEPHRKLNYRGLLGDFYRRILQLGLHRDLLPEGGSLTGYKLLFTPFVHYVSPEYTQRALEFAAVGGIWIVGPLTGGRTGEHTIHEQAGLGELERLAGVRTKYIYPMEGTGTVGKAFGVSAPLSLWSAVFEPLPEGEVGLEASGVRTDGASELDSGGSTSADGESGLDTIGISAGGAGELDSSDRTSTGGESGEDGTKVMGVITEGLTPGLAFVTERPYGKGAIVMLGSLPSGTEGDLLLQKLIDHYAAQAGVTLRSDVTPGTVVCPRRGAEGDVWTIVNMDGNGGSLTLPRSGEDAITGLPVSAGPLTLGAYEYKLIRL
ncbi:beta-galactosidase [Paenibacillus donghaensis]|uniref:beta-galactosidase n=1 Tax=Paenibacillus donghaensis TaxID=414771 RepID=A0A2Z2K4X7_9BACL|nr:beta-galactosidase [Paenibacillus donghaensis]ASA19474.1 beta-galactosidase [Paenibacillus donghaensis]